MCAPFHTLIFNKKRLLISAPPTGTAHGSLSVGRTSAFTQTRGAEVPGDIGATRDRTRRVRTAFSSLKGVQAERREREVLTVPESRQGRDSPG